MKLLQTSLSVATLMVATTSFAEVHIRISEDSTTINGVETPLDDVWENNAKVSSRSYSANGSHGQLDIKSSKSENVGDYVEFEVFEYGENFTSHSAYSSASGVCYAFANGRSVELTDSSTYFIKDSKTGEYYAAIIGANVSKKGAKNVQYAPVFNIKDPVLLEKIRQQEKKNGKKIVTENVKKRENILSNIVCQ